MEKDKTYFITPLMTKKIATKILLIFVIILEFSSAVFSSSINLGPSLVDYNIDEHIFTLENLSYKQISDSYINLTIKYRFNQYGDYLLLGDFYYNDLSRFRIFKDDFYTKNKYYEASFIIPIIYNYTKYNFELRIYKDTYLIYLKNFDNFITLQNIYPIERILPEYMIIPKIIFKYIEFQDLKTTLKNNFIDNVSLKFQTNIPDGEYAFVININDFLLNKMIKICKGQFNIKLNLDDLHKIDSELPYNILSITIHNSTSEILNREYEEGIYLNIQDENKLVNKSYPDLILLKEKVEKENQNYTKGDKKDIFKVYFLNFGNQTLYNISYKIINLSVSNQNFVIKKISVFKPNKLYFVGDYNPFEKNIILNPYRKITELDFGNNELLFGLNLNNLANYNKTPYYHLIKSLVQNNGSLSKRLLNSDSKICNNSEINNTERNRKISYSSSNSHSSGSHSDHYLSSGIVSTTQNLKQNKNYVEKKQSFNSTKLDSRNNLQSNNSVFLKNRTVMTNLKTSNLKHFLKQKIRKNDSLHTTFLKENKTANALENNQHIDLLLKFKKELLNFIKEHKVLTIFFTIPLIFIITQFFI